MRKPWSKRSGPRIALGIVILAGGVLGSYLAVGSVASSPQTPQQPAWESAQLFSFPGDWEAIPTTTFSLIYPAQASWQFVTGPQHPGSPSVQAGTACANCHGNPVGGASSVGGWAGPPTDHGESSGCQACHWVLQQEVKSLGEHLVADPDLELDPIEGKRPYIDVDVEAAYDSEFLYMRFTWASERPGITHDLWRYDGQEWVKWGGPKPDAPNKGVTPSYEDRLSLNISDRTLLAGDGSKASFAQQGCWITCHSSMRAMPKEPPVEDVEAHPYLGETGLGKSDVRKYLLLSREEADEAGGWDKVRTEDEIQRLYDEGEFLDMWMWRGARSGPIGYGDDFHVLEYRLSDDGKGPYTTPKQPEYMYDADKVGFYAIPEGDLDEMLSQFPMILGENVVPFDPEAPFKEGDVLSRRILRAPEGSRGDLLFNSRWQDGKWIVEMRRRLDTGNPDDKAFEPGRVYFIGLAIFDDMVSNRRHHVSFPLTLGIGAEADIEAVLVR